MLVEELARLWLNKHKALVKPRTYKTVKGTLNKHILPVFGKRDIEDIKALEVAEVIRGIAQVGSADLALRALSYVERMYEYAFIHEITLHDPTHRVKGYLALRRERQLKPFLTVYQLQTYIDVTLRDPCKIEVAMIFYTLAHSVVRLNELVLAQVSDFDFINGHWFIPAKNTKMNRDHIAIIPSQLKKVLTAYFDYHQSKWAFPNHKDYSIPTETHIIYDRNKPGGRGGCMNGVHSPHAFRHTFSTYANESNLFHPDWIEMTLAHKPPDIRGIYNKALYLKQREKMMQWYADELNRYVDFDKFNFMDQICI